MTVTLSSQGKPFGAVQENGIAFLLPEQMQRVAADYHADKARYRENHLPLVVGKLGPDLLRDIHALNPYGENFPLLFDRMQFPARIARDAEQMQGYMHSNLAESFSQERHSTDIRQLAKLSAQILCGIAQFSNRWFGESQEACLRVEHGMVSNTEGLHRSYQTSRWHRDGVKMDDAGRWLTFQLRTSLCASFAANQDTRQVVGPFAEDAQLDSLRVRKFRPEAGEIVLVATGPEGTIHKSQRPSPTEQPQATYFNSLVLQP